MANPVPTMLRICTGQVFWSGHVYRARAVACCNTWKLPLILSFPFPSSCEAGLDADFHISTHVSLSSLVSLAVPVDLSLKGSLTLRAPPPFSPECPLRPALKSRCISSGSTFQKFPQCRGNSGQTLGEN